MKRKKDARKGRRSNRRKPSVPNPRKRGPRGSETLQKQPTSSVAVSDPPAVRSGYQADSYATSALGSKDPFVLAAVIFFPTDSDKLDASDDSVIEKVAHTYDVMVRQGNSVHMEVVGYTDPRGTETLNMDLARRRARTVADAIGSRSALEVELIALGEDLEASGGRESLAQGRRADVWAAVGAGAVERKPDERIDPSIVPGDPDKSTGPGAPSILAFIGLTGPLALLRFALTVKGWYDAMHLYEAKASLQGEAYGFIASLRGDAPPRVPSDLASQQGYLAPQDNETSFKRGRDHAMRVVGESIEQGDVDINAAATIAAERPEEALNDVYHELLERWAAQEQGYFIQQSVVPEWKRERLNWPSR